MTSIPQPESFSEAIPYLNRFTRTPGALAQAMSSLFQQHPDYAAAIIPSYAKFLSGQDFEALEQNFPALRPLLIGYRQVLETAQAS